MTLHNADKMKLNGAVAQQPYPGQTEVMAVAVPKPSMASKKCGRNRLGGGPFLPQGQAGGGDQLGFPYHAEF